jgi:hypothetical protein
MKNKYNTKEVFKMDNRQNSTNINWEMWSYEKPFLTSYK